MAELIVAGPALIAVIQISDRIVGLCKHYIESVRDYPSDLRTILVEISFLKTTLENLNILTSRSGNTLDQSQGSHKLKDPIEECLRLVKKLEKLFPSDIQQSSITTSQRQKTKATLAQLAWPFKESKARKLLDLIRPLKQTFILELTSQSHQDIREIKTQTSKTREVVTESQRQEIYRWLQHIDPSSLYYKAQQDYEPETGNWVSRSTEWLDWIDSKNRCLWIHGIPGAGKTVLISHMIKTIQNYCKTPQAEGCVCVYYFCFYGHKQDEGKPFLQWTINQLCRQTESVPPKVLSMYKYGGEPSTVDLLEALEETLRDVKTAYVVIDALDESLPRDDMLEVVRQLVTDTRFRNLQLLASSRRYVDIQNLMEAISTPLSMDNDYVGADIRIYVQSFVHSNAKFQRFPAKLLSEIEDAVSTGAKGMFRWAVCQLDILQRLKCESDIIREALTNLPATLQETYDRVLLMLSEEERFIVHCLLEWISFYSELYEHGIPPQILAQAAERCTSTSNGFRSGYFHDENTIKELCGCLIKTFPEVVHGVPMFHTLTVKFAHYTVREYLDSGGLLRVPVAKLATPEKGLMPQPLKVVLEEAHRLHLNTAGLQKMTSPDCNSRLEAVFTDFTISCALSALLALKKWAFKIAQSEDLFHLAVGLLDPSSACFGFLCTVAGKIEDEAEFFSAREIGVGFWDVVFMKAGSPSAMQLLTLLKWVECGKSSFPLIKRFVEMIGIRQLTQERLRFRTHVLNVRRTNIIVIDGSIIEAAAQGLFREMNGFEQLLDLAEGLFDPSKMLRLYIGGYQGSDKRVLTKLLECGADPSFPNQRVTSLQIAVFSRCFAPVEILLKAGADPNEAGNAAESPWEGQSKMERYNNLFGASPLYILRKYDTIWGVRYEGRKDIEALLVEYGAKSFLRPEGALIMGS